VLIDLNGLKKKTPDEVAAMNREDLKQTIEDLRHIPSVQRHLPGVKQFDVYTLKPKSHSELVQIVLDIREAAA